MLTSVQLCKDDGTVITTFPIVDYSATSPYVITNVEGLDPVSADVVTSTYSPLDGAIIQGARLGVRNLVFTLRYRPDYRMQDTVQSLRWELYRLLPPKRTVKLVFLNDGSRYVQIDGIVESLETSIFSRDPQVQVSILCPDPDFVTPSSVYLGGTTGTPLNITSYAGTSKRGFVFEMTTTRNLSGFSLQVGDYPELVYSQNLLSGDSVRLSTIRSGKTVYHFRGGTRTPALDNITSGSLSMSFDRTSGMFNAKVPGNYAQPYTLTFLPGYVGL